MKSVNRLSRAAALSLMILSGAAMVAPTAGSALALQRVEMGDIEPPRGAPMSFADLIERVSPAVVEIQASVTRDPREADLEDVPPQFREWLERQFGDQAPTPRPQQSLGSGFFISAEGHIVTNNHVVAQADEITIGLSDGQEFPATLIGADPQTDLALLKIDADRQFPFVTLDESPNVRVGDWVVAVGNPFGLGGTATAGIISATGREIGNSTYNDFVQIDAPINRGNSGGPTFDLEGNVIGVNSQIFSPSGGNVGIGFAIPSDTAARIIEQLRENGRVERGWLGVQIQNVTEDIAASQGLEDARGAIVSSVVSGGPADDGGFERGDIITAINGEEVEGSRDLTQRVGAEPAGSRVTFDVLREGEEMTIRVELRVRPSEDELNAMPEQDEEDMSMFGMSLEPLGDDDRERLDLGEDAVGLVVTAIEPNEEASRKGMRIGDVILEAGGRDTATFEDFTAAVEAAREDGRSAILLLVEGMGGQRYVALQIDPS
jgi:serine protease Do